MKNEIFPIKFASAALFIMYFWLFFRFDIVRLTDALSITIHSASLLSIFRGCILIALLNSLHTDIIHGTWYVVLYSYARETNSNFHMKLVCSVYASHILCIHNNNNKMHNHNTKSCVALLLVLQLRSLSLLYY